MISVLVADHHPVVREHLAGAIAADARLELVGEAGDGTQAVLMAEERRPRSVVLDAAQVPGARRRRSVLKRLRELRSGGAGGAAVGPRRSMVQVRKALQSRPRLAVADGRRTPEVGCAMSWSTIEIDGVLSPRAGSTLERARLLARTPGGVGAGREREVLKLSAGGADPGARSASACGSGRARYGTSGREHLHEAERSRRSRWRSSIALRAGLLE